MGKGHPESENSVIARESKIFIADKLSTTGKNQLDSLDVEWGEFKSKNGYKRFLTVLNNLNVPAKDYSGNADEHLQEIFTKIFRQNTLRY